MRIPTPAFVNNEVKLSTEFAFYTGIPFDREWFHTFPVLGRGPTALEFSEVAAFDPTLKSQFDNGSVITRPRFTSVPRIWNIAIDRLSQTDKDTLASFERNSVHYSAKDFRWENTQDGVTYRVRFANPIRYVIWARDSREAPNHWRAEFQLVEAS